MFGSNGSSRSIVGADVRTCFRWFIRRDMKEVLRMTGLPEEVILTILRQRNCIGVVLETIHDDKIGGRGDSAIHGFMTYELHKCSLIVTHYGYDGCEGFGDLRTFAHHMVDHLTMKLKVSGTRNQFSVAVHDSNLDMQVELSHLGMTGFQSCDDTIEFVKYVW